MPDYAKDFYDIPEAIESNQQLRNSIIGLVRQEPIPSKATEGGNRTENLRQILIEFFRGDISLQDCIDRISSDLPRRGSPYASNNRVFADRWEERLARTQISRFYNQAVLEELQKRGDSTCFIPVSDHQDLDSQCTKQLAGQKESVDMLYERLIETYRNGSWNDKVKIPDHPHCTHTVYPVKQSGENPSFM